MNSKAKSLVWCIIALALAIGEDTSQASTATANININLPVNSPACTLSNSGGTEINMPPAASTITVNQYFSQNGFTVSPAHGSAWVILSSLKQTTTFSCDTPNTPILSFVVQPAPGAVFNWNGYAAYPVDAAATPVQAANGGLIVAYEQSTINGTPTVYAYNSGNGYPLPYTTTFFTSSTLTNGQSEATVQWYPTFYPLSGNNPMGAPTGGQFSTPATIIVTY